MIGLPLEGLNVSFKKKIKVMEILSMGKSLNISRKTAQFI